ncbi:uncharacterized protein RHO17_008654 [Thomomys bottae]
MFTFREVFAPGGGEKVQISRKTHNSNAAPSSTRGYGFCLVLSSPGLVLNDHWRIMAGILSLCDHHVPAWTSQRTDILIPSAGDPVSGRTNEAVLVYASSQTQGRLRNGSHRRHGLMTERPGGPGSSGDRCPPEENRAPLGGKLRSQCGAAARGIGRLGGDAAWAGPAGLRQWRRGPGARASVGTRSAALGASAEAPPSPSGARRGIPAEYGPGVRGARRRLGLPRLRAGGGRRAAAGDEAGSGVRAERPRPPALSERPALLPPRHFLELQAPRPGARAEAPAFPSRGPQLMWDRC